MGTVYEAHHTAIRRRVAVKILKAALAADEEMIHRFEREALAASSVRSKHVVEVFDVGALDDGERYMILEYLDGESLSQRLKRGGTMTPAEAFPIAAQLLDGLAAAHDEGIIHRDLKPANIYLCQNHDGEELVKVLDFGVSKFSALGGEAFTQTGALVGTPHYMAPELTEGASKADARSDIYGVGAILFRVLTGKTPYTAETIHELIAKLIREDPKRLAEVAPRLSRPATTLVDRALSKDPGTRFADARSMAQALRDVMTDPSLLTVRPSDADDDCVTLRAPDAPLTPPSHSHPSWREMQGGRSPSSAALGELSASGRNRPVPASPPETHTPASLPGAADVTPASPIPNRGQSFTGATVLRAENAPEPPTLVTPSPATLDSIALPPKPRPKAWLVGVGLGAALAVGAGALLLGGGPPSRSAPAAVPSSPSGADEPKRVPSEDDATPAPLTSETAEPEPAEPEPAEPEPADPETTDPEPSARVTSPQPNPSRPRAHPVRPPPRVAPPPPPAPSRDIREDLE